MEEWISASITRAITRLGGGSSEEQHFSNGDTVAMTISFPKKSPRIAYEFN